jgi:hypothetical protein
MSFREKRAWISLVTTFAVWAFYFVTMVARASAGRLQSGHVPGLFAGCIVTLVCVQVALNTIVSARSPRDARTPADERETLIELKATRLAFYTLGIAVMVVATATPLASTMGLRFFTADPTADALLLICNGILLAAVAAELVRSGGQIVQFRRAG